MKRYDLEDTGYGGEADFIMTEDPEGEWVKYEDVKGIEKLGFGRVHCALCEADLSKGNHLPSCPLLQTKHDGIEPPRGVLATGGIVSEEAMDKIREALGIGRATKIQISPEEGEFIDSRPVDYKRWLPRIIRDLVRRRTP